MADLYHDENTMQKIYDPLIAAGLTDRQATDAIMAMQNSGILFREVGPPDPWVPEFGSEGSSIEGAVFQALGAVSVCWENMEGTGIFDSTRAKWIGDGLLKYIRENGDCWKPINDLTEAIRLTVEYTGIDMLPPIEGWSWYDAMVRYAPEVAKIFKDQERPVPRR